MYEEAVSHIWLCNRSLQNFLKYEENLIFFFYQCGGEKVVHRVYGGAFFMRDSKICSDPPFLTASELERQLHTFQQQNYGPDKIFSIHLRLPAPTLMDFTLLLRTLDSNFNISHSFAVNMCTHHVTSLSYNLNLEMNICWKLKLKKLVPAFRVKKESVYFDGTLATKTQYL